MKKIWWILIVVAGLLLVLGIFIGVNLFSGSAGVSEEVDPQVREDFNRLFNEMTSGECEEEGGSVIPDPNRGEITVSSACGEGQQYLGKVVLGDNAFICCKAL